MSCAARRDGDEMACACGLRWAVGDERPAKCPPPRTPRGPYKPKAKPARPAPGDVVLLDDKAAAALAQAYELALMEHRALPHDARQITAMRQALRRFKITATGY